MQFKKLLSSIMLGAFICFCAYTPAFGAEVPTNEELLKAIEVLKGIIQKQDKKIEELGKIVSGHQEKIENHSEVIKTESIQDESGRLRNELSRLKNIGGLEIGAGVTFIGQGTPNANNGDSTDGEDSRFDGNWSADIEIAKEFGDYGMAFLHMEAGQGNNVTDELTLFSNVNADATGFANLDIIEVWYEQYLFSKQLTITAGKIDATCYLDTNEYANDECTQFLGDMFRNSAVIDWPDDNNWGARMYIAPEMLSFMDVEALYMEEDGDWENLFDNPFFAAQVNFMPAKLFNYDEDMWGGNYRAYVWYNGASHARIDDPTVIKRGNVGFGFSCDQKITDVYGVFGRFGWADSTRNDLGYDWSIGAQMIGRYWNREEDVLAIAVGQAIPGKEYEDENEFSRPETHVEAYYSFKVNDHLTLSPDMQIIWDANGGGTVNGKDTDTIFVYGVRGQVDF